MLTIVFCSFHSEKHIIRQIRTLSKDFLIVVVDNSKNVHFKNFIKSKYKNIKVIFPKKNLGLAGAYNLGLKYSLTKFVMLCPADIIINKKTIKRLLKVGEKIKNFSVLGMAYKDSSLYQNFGVLYKKNKTNLKNVLEVDWIDNSYIVNKKKIGKKLFDENYFLYFETWDFCRQLQGVYVCQNIKYVEMGSKSVDLKYSFQIQLSRAWHYNWSKFYYLKKFNGYFYAFRTSLKYILKYFFELLLIILNLKKKNFYVAFAELSGLLNSMFLRKSFYRPFERPKGFF